MQRHLLCDLKHTWTFLPTLFQIWPQAKRDILGVSNVGLSCGLPMLMVAFRCKASSNVVSVVEVTPFAGVLVTYTVFEETPALSSACVIWRVKPNAERRRRNRTGGRGRKDAAWGGWQSETIVRQAPSKVVQYT